MMTMLTTRRHNLLRPRTLVKLRVSYQQIPCCPNYSILNGGNPWIVPLRTFSLFRFSDSRDLKISCKSRWEMASTRLVRRIWWELTGSSDASLLRVRVRMMLRQKWTRTQSPSKTSYTQGTQKYLITKMESSTRKMLFLMRII